MKSHPSNRKKENIFYVLILLLAVVVLGGIDIYSEHPQPLSKGGFWETVRQSFDTFLSFVSDHATSQFGLLLAQVLIILVVARSVAWVFMKIGQPTVMGEIIAGIILGPSVLGLFFPHIFESIFPSESLYNISLLSQFGLILFMFVIGMELDISEIKKHLRKTLIISHAGIVIPFVLGAIAAVFLFDKYGTPGSALFPFALFLGISMSITAFPVLARIVQERGEMSSQVGIISLASAACGDITAWCMIAVIMALSQAGSATSALFTILFAAIYVAAMFLLVRPLFKLVGKVYDTNEVASKGVIAMIFLTLLVSSYLTEILGLHALFGAFMVGVIMPDDMKFRRILTDKVEDVSLSIFLPLFFVASGLQTQIGLLNTPEHWVVTLLLILIAIIGKLGGTYVASRMVGETPRDSLFIGILMNTRGLMELIVLSMGYSLGILSPVIYAILVLMTLVTTVMTTPLMDFATRILRHCTQEVEPFSSRPPYRILFSFGRTTTATLMLRLVDTFFSTKKDACAVTAMHMTVGTDINPVQAEYFRATSFAPIRSYAERHVWKVDEHYEVTDDPVGSILKTADSYEATLLLVGAGIDLSTLPRDMEINRLRSSFRSRFGLAYRGASSLFATNLLLQDKSEVFVRRSPCSVGIVLDRGLRTPARKVLVVHHSSAADIDRYTPLVRSLIQGRDIHSVCLDLSPLQSSLSVNETGQNLKGGQLYGTETLLARELSADVLQGYDLMLISYATWEMLIVQDSTILARIPTTILLASRMQPLQQ